ncbi:MAG: hypothetical protein FJW86_03850 [Actinobacteria bacterium]|nr:hypothetical protein [Actinomycetota bacterium]
MSRLGRALLAALVLAAVLGAPRASGAEPAPSRHPFDALELPGVEKMGISVSRGERPRFTWKTVDGALEYALVVQTLNGEPYWAWRGTSTKVFLGGERRRPANAAGPVLTRAAQYQVTAFDAELRIVGASEWRVVAPH